MPQSLSVVSLSNKWYVTFSIIGSTPVKQFLSSVVPSESSPAVAVNFNVYTWQGNISIGNHKNHGEKDMTHYDKNFTDQLI